MRILWNIDYGDILPISIINRIFRTALLAVEHGDHTASVVDHPFIAALEAATIILQRNKTDDIGTDQNRSIATLPRWRPCTFKALIGACGNQMNRRAPLSRRRRTTSAAQMSTPLAIPEMKVWKPSVIAARISRSSEATISTSLLCQP